MTLNETVELMNSEDYKDRFRAEYWQTKIRYDKLHEICKRYDAGKLELDTDCGINLLKEQKRHMGNYLYTLEVRALMEEIEL